MSKKPALFTVTIIINVPAIAMSLKDAEEAVMGVDWAEMALDGFLPMSVHAESGTGDELDGSYPFWSMEANKNVGSDVNKNARVAELKEVFGQLA